MRFARGVVVVVLPLLYFSCLFQVWRREFWTAGLGEWMDPYFMNALLEHWYHSARTFADPSSPPMYFPVPKTLAYSHGLVLYAPFYIPLRLLLHPFRAYNVTLLLVLVTGAVCLYVVLRRLRLPPLESLLLTALFVSSRNVDNGIGIWIQRASVFFIPPIVLILLASHRMRERRAGVLLAGLGGLLATLMYVQDFYTAHFTLLLGLLLLIAFASAGRTRRLLDRAACLWRAQPRAARFAFAAAAVLATWAACVWIVGGVQTRVFGVGFTARGFLRPVVAAVLALAAGFVLSRDARDRVRAAATPWRLAVTAGAAAGAVFFLWIYLDAYRQHPSFPEDQLWRSLAARDPSQWRGPMDVFRALRSYPSFRSFGLTFVLAAATWLPWLRFDARARALSLWWIAISLFVLLLPLRFNELSIWKASIGRLPGFVSIRDPSRIIQVYDLAAIFAAAWLLARAPANRTLSACAGLLMLFLLVRGSYTDVFEYERPIAVYERWVAAPIDVDPSCASFYVKGGSREYMSRSRHMWSLYGLDGLFVALKYSIPTLNGYSAWAPADWSLHDPQNPGYDVHVRDWIRMHGLRDVCELDLEARTMKPGIR